MPRNATYRFATLAAALLACACSSAEPRVAPQPPGPAASPGDPATRPAPPEQPGPARESAPAFSLRDHQGTEHSLATLTASGPTVLVFYRGHW